MNERKQGSTNYPYQFFMASSADHVAGVTGLTPAVQLSKNGGSFAAATGSVTELAFGWYSLSANTTDRNLLGACAIHASASGCDPFDGKITVVPWDPFDPNLSLAALPNAAAGTSGGLPTVDANNAVKLQAGTGPNQVNLSGGSVSVYANGDKAGYSLTQGFPANFVSLAIGAAGSITAGSVTDKAGYKVSSDGLDAITIESGVNARQAVSAILASSVGVLSGAASNRITIQGGNVSTTRITATVDPSGNRPSVALSLPT